MTDTMPHARSRWLPLLAAAAILGGCSKKQEALPLQSTSSAGSAAPAPKHASVTDSLDTPTAFDLSAAPHGATLAWAQRDRGAVTLRAQSFDTDGVPRTKPFALTLASKERGKVSDLSFAWLQRSPIAAWVERFDTEARVQAVMANDPQAPDVFDLGPAWLAPVPARGNLALSTDAERALVFVRGVQDECVGSGSEACFGFRFHDIPNPRNVDRVALSVPVPCSQSSALLAMTSPRWHYAVCTTQAGSPVLTVFNIQPKPEYASAETVLDGCEPRGAVRLGERALLVAQCGDQQRIARLQKTDTPITVEPHTPKDPTCTPDALLVTVGNSDVTLREPQDGLQTLLPASLTPVGTRATWTGRSLLVAEARAADLLVTRYTCQRGHLAKVSAAAEP